MADMFEVVAIFGIIKPLILDLPPALGPVIPESVVKTHRKLDFPLI